jgi:dTDP-L-rhamnose 4-epimerase
MKMKILVTGGAGFIGTHLARYLLGKDCEVSILDNFSPQVHGNVSDLPPDLARDVTLYRADVRDKDCLQRAVRGQNVVVHLAAETGTAQSMYEISRYEAINIGGTANLVDLLVNDSSRTVSKLIVASSRAVYGEGKYHCNRDGVVFPHSRKREDMRSGQYEPRCPHCEQPCQVMPTSEESPFHSTSFYGLTKQVQEQMVVMFARVTGLSGCALRYQNVYGPGQSLSNPYTGILAIFANQARANQPIHVFEDGYESRDFVYVEDVVEATWRCILLPDSSVQVMNVGSGYRTTVAQVAREIVSVLASTSRIEIDGSFREGDVRHNYADVGKARSLIGFEPRWKFRDGLQEFLRWAQSQELITSRYESSLLESRERGILHA